jgi:predicted acylesterase/phospholipase RssA
MLLRFNPPGAALRTRSLIGLLLLGALLAAGCASTKRLPFTPEAIARANADTLGGIRYPSDHAPALATAKSAADYNVLALSGGGPDGAFGVGLLTGWSKTGTRPVFDVVTGVSTGALIAPYAFLGASEDATLGALYTGDHLKTLLQGGSTLKLLTGPNAYRNSKLKALIAENVTTEMLAAIAAEHRRGRRLFVASANLDAQQMIIWDMGAIAARGTAESQDLFETILLAATSVPLALNPVAIPIASAPAGFTETHVDASVFAHIYVGAELFPVEACLSHQRRCALHIIVHNKTVAEPQIVRWSAAGIGKRSIQTLLKASLNTRLQSTWRLAHESGVAFRMAYLDVPFDGVSPVDFDIAYMQRLYALGLGRAADPKTWLDTPPNAK